MDQSNKCKVVTIGKLLEEREELIEAKEKWESGTEKLQVLHREVTAKLAHNTDQEKENIKQEECLDYFEQKSRQRQGPYPSKTRATAKGTILKQLQLRVSKS